MIKENLYVVKIGGNIVDDELQLLTFLQSYAQLPGKKILIHGGGKMATKLAEDLHIPQQMVEGRRITDAETLRIVTMVYAGYINKNIVAHLQKQQLNAVGFSGVDGNILLASKRKHSNIDYGFVGDIEKVNDPFLKSLLDKDIAMVIAPITHNGEGVLLNTNADTIAQEIATAMTTHYHVQLIFSFEKSGVLADIQDEASVIPTLSRSLYHEYKTAQKIYAGMIPKLDNAFKAIDMGVDKVIIGKAEDLKSLTTGKTGTILTNE